MQRIGYIIKERKIFKSCRRHYSTVPMHLHRLLRFERASTTYVTRLLNAVRAKNTMKFTHIALKIDASTLSSQIKTSNVSGTFRTEMHARCRSYIRAAYTDPIWTPTAPIGWRQDACEMVARDLVFNLPCLGRFERIPYRMI